MNTIISLYNGPKTRNSIYTQDILHNMLVHLACKKVKYNLTTKTGKKCLFAELSKAMETMFTVSVIPSILNTYGIGTPDNLANEIIENRDFLSSIVKLNLNGLVLDKALTRNQQKGKKLVEENGCGSNPYEVSDINLNDVERLVVVRTKYGTHEPKMYTMKGTMCDKNVNGIRAMYSYETGCNYYEARAILYTTWITLSDEYKMASRPCEEDDLKDVME